MPKSAIAGAARSKIAEMQRKTVVIGDHGWTGAQWGLQNPTFTLGGTLVGEGFIRVTEAKLLKEVTLKGIPEDLDEVLMTADLQKGPYVRVSRNKDNKFVLPVGYDLTPAITNFYLKK